MPKAKPILLQIVLSEQEFSHLMADDDWISLRQKGEKKRSATDWYRSLVEMGQVACNITIPPNRITVLDEVTQ